MKTLALNAARLFLPPLFMFGLALPLFAKPTNPAHPLAWVQSDAYGIKYKVPVHWTRSEQTTDAQTRITYTSPDGDITLTITKQKASVPEKSARQLLDTLTARFCPDEKLVLRTRYNRLSFWEATGFTRQPGRTGRYEALASDYRGNTICLYLETNCRLVYNRNEETIHQIFSSVAPH